MSKTRVIGKNGSIPWHIPEDLRIFREKTRNHTVVMGRKTYESIGGPLAGRNGIVLSRNSTYRATGMRVFPSLDAVLAHTGTEGDEVFIIGGQKVYEEALERAGRIYCSIVEGDYEGDTFFPPIPDTFREVSRKRYDTRPPFTLIVMEKKT